MYVYVAGGGGGGAYLADNQLIGRTENRYMIDSYLTGNHSKNSTIS